MARALVCAYACAPPGSETFAGGEELLGWRLVTELGRRHDLDVLVSGVHRASLEDAPAPDGTEFVFLGLPRPLRPLLDVQGGIQLYAYLWQIRALRVARSLHERRDYDLFHHVTYANDWMASYIGAFLPIPYVRGPGGGAQQVPRELRPNYGWGFRIRQIARRLGQVAFRSDPVFRRGQDRAARLYVCTEESMEVYARRWTDKAELMPVVGLTEDDFPEVVDRSRRDFVAMTAGKLLPHKGMDLAIRAFAAFRENAGEGTLVVAGEGPERERLNRLARSLNIGDHVEFTGWLARHQVLKRLRSSDVFLFPSLRDGGGAVVVEAMAAGLPVVCLDIAGPGLHVDEECGFAVEPGRASDVVRKLASALSTLHSSPRIRKKMGKNARRRAWNRYRWSSHADRIDELYDSIAARDTN